MMNDSQLFNQSDESDSSSQLPHFLRFSSPSSSDESDSQLSNIFALSSSSASSSSNESDSLPPLPTAPVLQICSIDTHSAVFNISTTYFRARINDGGFVTGYQLLFKEHNENEYQTKELLRETGNAQYHEITGGSAARLML